MSDNPDEQARLHRERINLEINELIQSEGNIYRITEFLDFQTLIAKSVETGRSSVLRLDQIYPLSSLHHEQIPEKVQIDIEEIADEDWKLANTRYDIIQPLLEKETIGRNDVQTRSQEIGVSVATLYRWLNRYRSSNTLSSLIPMSRGWKKDRTRLATETETLIDEVIQSFYLTHQRPTQQKAVLEVLRLCQLKKIPPPGASAIRQRILRISEKNRLKGRGFKEKAKNKFSPVPGQYPGADYPLSVIQIDHTPVDIILVDDIHRKPIGRPWLTVAIDVYSRMVTGYYLSFDPPSGTSVAMCIAHSIIPKEEWLRLHKIDSEWPVWGFPNMVHVDNGADFRAENFRQSCLMYGIHLSFRPVKTPRYGGHIERLLGTFMNEVHDIPGTTFSSVKDREGYDSEKNAIMTMSEFELWLLKSICKIYHHRTHNSIGMPPLKKWEIGIFGNADTEGIGMPARPANKFTIMLDFLPAYRRTVQTFGVTIEGITYYTDALRFWINASDPETQKKKQLIFRRDPRDVSFIWFFEPKLKEYFKVPVANQAWPSLSVWEYRQAKDRLKQKGYSKHNDHDLLMAITELRNDIEASKEKTKKARRLAQRRREHEKKITPATPFPSTTEKETKPIKRNRFSLPDDAIKPYKDIS